jgi:hypothetical protein
MSGTEGVEYFDFGLQHDSQPAHTLPNPVRIGITVRQSQIL